MGSFIQKFSIKAKLWSGFIFLLLVLVIVSVFALSGLGNTQDKAAIVVDEIQPVAIQALEIQNTLNLAVSFVGYYLLTKDDEYLQDFDSSLARITDGLNEMAESGVLRNHAVHADRMQSIKTTATQLGAMRDKIVQLASDDGVRVPAIQYSNANLNPLAIEVQSLISQMVVSELAEGVSEERREILNAIHELRNTWANLLLGLRGYLAFQADAMRDNTTLYFNGFGKAMDELAEYGDLLTFEEQDAVDKIRSKRVQYGKHLEQVFAIHGGEKSHMDAYVTRTEIRPLVDEMTHEIKALVSGLQDEVNSNSQELVDTVDNTRALVVGLLAVGLVVGVLVAMLMTLAITRPLQVTIQAMDDISQGEGDLTKRLDESGHDEIAQLASAFNRFAEKVRGIVSQVALSTTRLGAASEELTTVMSATSSNIQREKQDIDQIATAITEMNATVHEVASHSSSAAESAQDSASEAEEGKHVVDEAIKVIEKLATEIEQAAQVIQKLDVESKNIGGVLDVITSIAEQTNLLALNAAIEAARAGEQGRGFAVVADEVRTLAARTQQSTLEIQDMISRLQAEVNNAVHAMETSRSMAQTGVEHTGIAGESLQRIAYAVISIREKNSEIAHATEQQSTVAEEINQKIVSISQLGEQNADGSQGAANSSSELAMLAMELQALVAQFKT